MEVAAKTKIPYTIYYTTAYRIISLIGSYFEERTLDSKKIDKQQKRNRISASKENLFLHSLEPDFFESHIVTGDETWVHHYEPETKRQSIQVFYVVI